MGGTSLFGLACWNHLKGASVPHGMALDWRMRRWSIIIAQAVTVVIALVRPVQFVGFWLLGLTILISSIMGLTSSWTWSRFSIVREADSPVLYWFWVLLEGVIGTALIAAATYLLGVAGPCGRC